MKLQLKTKSGKEISLVIAKSILSCKVDGLEIGGKLDREASNLPSGYVAVVGGRLPITKQQLSLIDEATNETTVKRHISDLCPLCGSYCYGDCTAN